MGDGRNSFPNRRNELIPRLHGERAMRALEIMELKLLGFIGRKLAQKITFRGLRR